MDSMMRRCVLYFFLQTLLIMNSAFSQSTESLMNSGTMLLQNGAYDQAVTKFRQVIARDPSNFEAQYNLAFGYLHAGRYSNAVTEFKKAVRLNPQSAEAWSNLAMAYQHLGKTSEALGALYRAVDYNPRNVQARMNLATMYANNGRLNEAIKQYKLVLQVDGTNYDAHINLAKCLISQKQFTAAQRLLKSAVAINPNEAEAYWELGNILSSIKKDYAGAITNYKKAVALQPNSQVYYENYGLLLEDLWAKNSDDSRRSEAIDVWKKYLVYLDDALKKEQIQDRLALLEQGKSPSGKTAPEELFGNSGITNARVEELKKEIRSDQDTGSVDELILNTEGFDIDAELIDLNSQADSTFEFNLNDAVKKRIGKSGNE